MSVLAHRGDPAWDRTRRVAHAGTFNANPLSAAAAVATLELIGDGSLAARASKSGDAIRQGLERATRTLRGVTSAWIKEQQVKLRDGKVAEYQVNMQITFILEDYGRAAPGQPFETRA